MNKQHPILELKNIRKSFDGVVVLDDITLAVYPGEIIGYVGSNGAGKSTTIKIILGLLSADEGSVRVFGEEINTDDVLYKKRIGYLPENIALFDELSAKEYFEFLADLHGLNVRTAVDRSSKLLLLLNIDDEQFQSRIASYSKGMRQKVSIVASLLHNPDILFWDEPLNGLDASSIQVIKAVLNRLRDKGKSIFYSSHIMDTVEKLSDRIILLDNGHIKIDAAFEDLKDSSDYNLEKLFNHVTGFDKREELAQKFIEILYEEGGAVNG